MRVVFAAIACFAVACTTPTTTLINWNTYHRFHHGKRAAEGAAWLAEQQPDLVALQELTDTRAPQFAAWAGSFGHPFSAMNKENGYALGITSRTDLRDVTRAAAGFHHGFLHAQVAGIDLFVVHFWPDRLQEPREILRQAAELLAQHREVLVVGDFNNHARTDLEWLSAKPHLMRKFDGKQAFDTRMTDLFLDVGFIDLVAEHAPQAKYTFGSPALIPAWAKDMAAVASKRQRIDFAFASPGLAARVIRAEVLTDDTREGQLSDHYPLRITWRNAP